MILYKNCADATDICPVWVNATDTDRIVALTRDIGQISMALAQFLYPWH